MYKLEKLYSHLEDSRNGNNVRIMYYDFSSAFNTMQPHILTRKLLNMGVTHQLVGVILDFLTNRRQFVKLNDEVKSNCIVSNTGAPQGTVLAPFLFTLYTSDFRSSHADCPVIKFADDTALLGLIKYDDDSHYKAEVDCFVRYCNENYLKLNIVKTKELIIDFRKNKNNADNVVINNTCVERVSTYKYLGVVFDDKLKWGDHIDSLMKKLNSRMYCLRKMNDFNVRSEILTMFYKSVICGVWAYCLTGWGGNTSKADIGRIDCIIRKVGRITGSCLQTVDSIYHERVTRLFTCILDDESHPLHDTLMNSVIQRSGRMRLPKSRTNRHLNSLVPMGIKFFNMDFVR